MTLSASSRFTSLAALAAALLFLGSWIVLHRGFYDDEEIVDIPVYETYGNAIERGSIPYRDFRLEYPPGALPVFALPALTSARGDQAAFRVSFERLMAACGVAAVLLAALVLAGLQATRVRVASALAAVALLPLLLGNVILTRFDLWPAALTLAALAALVWRRDRLGFGLLGVAVAAKLYPAVLVPLALAYVWQRRGRREALVCLGILAGVIAVAFGPFLALAPDGMAYSFGRQLGRPLQIESLGSSFFLAAHHLFGLELEMRSGHGSQNLDGVGPAVAGVLLEPRPARRAGLDLAAPPGHGRGARALERRRSRRVRRAREGALAPVPDLARPARPARRRPARAARLRAPRRSRSC